MHEKSMLTDEQGMGLGEWKLHHGLFWPQGFCLLLSMATRSQFSIQWVEGQNDQGSGIMKSSDDFASLIMVVQLWSLSSETMVLNFAEKANMHKKSVVAMDILPHLNSLVSGSVIKSATSLKSNDKD